MQENISQCKQRCNLNGKLKWYNNAVNIWTWDVENARINTEVGSFETQELRIKAVDLVLLEQGKEGPP